jgi:hypothetical protein
MSPASIAKKSDPVEKSAAWVRLWGSAWTQVSACGGPIQKPYEPVLQLIVRPWAGDDESWTIYRDPRSHNPGKTEVRKWDRSADLKRCRALGTRRLPSNWEATVVKRQFPLSAHWVRGLERRIATVLVPPIAGTTGPISRDNSYELKLWRGSQESTFQWSTRPPAAWKPISVLFFSLVESFRSHIDGKPLVPVTKL